MLQALLLSTLQAILSKQRAETLSSVLYPDDRTYEGKELRLKQQHFFVSATVQVGRCMLPQQHVPAGSRLLVDGWAEPGNSNQVSSGKALHSQLHWVQLSCHPFFSG